MGRLPEQPDQRRPGAPALRTSYTIWVVSVRWRIGLRIGLHHESESSNLSDDSALPWGKAMDKSQRPQGRCVRACSMVAEQIDILDPLEVGSPIPLVAPIALPFALPLGMKRKSLWRWVRYYKFQSNQKLT